MIFFSQGTAGRSFVDRVVWMLFLKIRVVILESLEVTKQFFEMLVGQKDGHFQALGMSVQPVDHGKLSLLLPYSDRIVGNPETGVVHGGCLTALLDTVCGLAAATALDKLSLCPTIDLRIDYMSSARPGEAIIGEAEAIRITPSVIFTQGIAHQGDPENPVARCSANFLRMGSSVVGDMQEHFDALLQSTEQ